MKLKHLEVKGKRIRFLKHLRYFKILNNYQAASQQPISSEAHWAKSHSVGNHGDMQELGTETGDCLAAGMGLLQSQDSHRSNPRKETSLFSKGLISGNSDRQSWVICWGPGQSWWLLPRVVLPNQECMERYDGLFQQKCLYEQAEMNQGNHSVK